MSVANIVTRQDGKDEVGGINFFGSLPERGRLSARQPLKKKN
jgi:hypothetical protein